MTTQGQPGAAEAERPVAAPHPKGSVKLLVCVGPRCDAEGRGRALLAEVEAALQAQFAQALAQGRLTLATRDCLRLCTRDPVVRLEPSGDAFSDPDLDVLVAEIAGALE
jgi:NADH:ubiquinone oxidoreductase subunit E